MTIREYGASFLYFSNSYIMKDKILPVFFGEDAVWNLSRENKQGYFWKAYSMRSKYRTEYGNRALAETYLNRINHFRTNPPLDSWSGVYTHTEK